MTLPFHRKIDKNLQNSDKTCRTCEKKIKHLTLNKKKGKSSEHYFLEYLNFLKFIYGIVIADNSLSDILYNVSRWTD